MPAFGAMTNVPAVVPACVPFSRASPALVMLMSGPTNRPQDRRSGLDVTGDAGRHVRQIACKPPLRDRGPVVVSPKPVNDLGGMLDLGQVWTRPSPRLVPYSTPDPRIYLCSSSTPPGGGVHGMCGYLAAEAAMRRLR